MLNAYGMKTRVETLNVLCGDICSLNKEKAMLSA
jgi:hypothetical protein